MISITGVKEIDRVLKELPKQMTHQILGAAHAAAAKPLIEKAKLLAPEGPAGNLVDSIGVTKTNIKKANKLGEVRGGPRRKGGFKGFAGHLVEFGTKVRRTRKGANRGLMRPKPFMRPAFTATKGQIEKDIALQIGRVMTRTMRRYLKR
jgi:HK97 gp10 family phage protein